MAGAQTSTNIRAILPQPPTLAPQYPQPSRSGVTSAPSRSLPALLDLGLPGIFDPRSANREEIPSQTQRYPLQATQNHQQSPQYYQQSRQNPRSDPGTALPPPAAYGSGVGPPQSPYAGRGYPATLQYSLLNTAPYSTVRQPVSGFTTEDAEHMRNIDAQREASTQQHGRLLPERDQRDRGRLSRRAEDEAQAEEGRQIFEARREREALRQRALRDHEQVLAEDRQLRERHAREVRLARAEDLERERQRSETEGEARRAQEDNPAGGGRGKKDKDHRGGGKHPRDDGNGNGRRSKRGTK